MNEKFILNLPSITEKEQELIAAKRVLVSGCGGLGGYVSEYLARLGISHITVLDFDCFEESNVNRQILATASTIGKSKAEVSKERILSINPNADVTAVNARISSENAVELIRGHDLVIDALDNVETRLVLEEACTSLDIPMIHGAVHGWTYQAAFVAPGSGLMKKLYSKSKGNETKTVLSFVPPCCAAVQVSEALLYLSGRPNALNGKILFSNMETAETTVINI